MSTNTIPIPTAGIVKPVMGDRFTSIYAARMLPPEVRNDRGNKQQLLVRYITAQGEEKKALCTPRVFKRSLGTRQRRAAHTGLDHQVHHSFVLKQEVETQTVTAIHAYPRIIVAHSLQRGDVPAHNHLVVNVDPAGGDLTVEDVPAKIKEAHIKHALLALDKQGLLQADTDIGYGMRIRSVSGSIIYVNVDDLSDDNPGIVDEDSMFLPQEA